MVITGGSTAGIMTMTFLELSHSERPSLACFLDNGILLTVENLPVSELSAPNTLELTNADLIELFKTLKISKHSTPFRRPEKVLMCSVPMSQRATTSAHTFLSILIDDSWALHVMSISLSPDMSAEVVASFTDEEYVDAVVLPHTDSPSSPCLGLLHSRNLDITLLNLSTQSVLAKYRASLLSPLSGGCDYFLMADMAVHTCSGHYDIIFSLGSPPLDVNLRDEDKSMSPTRVYTMALLDGGHMMLLDDTALPATGHATPSRLAYIVGNDYSENAGNHMTTWRNSTEITVSKYSPHLWTALESIRRLRSGSEVPHELLDAAEIVGCLMRPHVPADTFALIADRCKSLPVGDLVLVLRFALMCQDTPISFFRHILLTAMVRGN